MFFDLKLLRSQRNGSFLQAAWIASTRGVQHVSVQDVRDLELVKLCEEILEKIVTDSADLTHRFSLRLAALLTDGTVKLYRRKAQILQDDISKYLNVIRTPQIIDLLELRRGRDSDSSENSKQRQLSTQLTPVVKPRKKKVEKPKERESESPLEQFLVPDKELEKQLDTSIKELDLHGAILQARTDDITIREDMSKQAVSRPSQEDDFGAFDQPPLLLLSQGDDRLSQLEAEILQQQITALPVIDKSNLIRLGSKSPDSPKQALTSTRISVEALVHSSAGGPEAPPKKTRKSKKSPEKKETQLFDEIQAIIEEATAQEKDIVMPTQKPEKITAKPRSPLKQLQVEEVSQRDAVVLAQEPSSSIIEKEPVEEVTPILKRRVVPDKVTIKRLNPLKNVRINMKRPFYNIVYDFKPYPVTEINNRDLINKYLESLDTTSNVPDIVRLDERRSSSIRGEVGRRHLSSQSPSLISSRLVTPIADLPVLTPQQETPLESFGITPQSQQLVAMPDLEAITTEERLQEPLIRAVDTSTPLKRPREEVTEGSKKKRKLLKGDKSPKDADTVAPSGQPEIQPLQPLELFQEPSIITQPQPQEPLELFQEPSIIAPQQPQEPSIIAPQQPPIVEPMVVERIASPQEVLPSYERQQLDQTKREAEIRQQNIVDKVFTWNYFDKELTLEDLLEKPASRLKAARIFSDLLILCKAGYVKLRSDEDSCNLKCILKGRKMI